MHILGYEVKRVEICENAISIELYNGDDAEELLRELLYDDED